MKTLKYVCKLKNESRKLNNTALSTPLKKVYDRENNAVQHIPTLKTRSR